MSSLGSWPRPARGSASAGMSTTARAVRDVMTRCADSDTSATIATMTGVLLLMEAGRISTATCASHVSAPDWDRASAMAKVTARNTMSSVLVALNASLGTSGATPGSRRARAPMSATIPRLNPCTGAATQSATVVTTINAIASCCRVNRSWLTGSIERRREASSGVRNRRRMMTAARKLDNRANGSARSIQPR